METKLTEKKLTVYTAAGDIIAEATEDPGAPGIGLFWVPKGSNLEIELALVEVKQDPEYRHFPEDSEENVAMYIYEDVSSDQWTKRINYMKNDVDNLFADVVLYLKTYILTVHTAAGDIIAKATDTSEASGIGLFWVPKGKYLEIKMALAVEDSERNVAMYISRDVSSLKWAQKIDYRKEEVDELFVNGLA